MNLTTLILNNQNQEQERAFHLQLRNHHKNLITYLFLADWYEENGYTDTIVIEYLRLMHKLMINDRITAYASEIWELIKDNDKFFVMGFNIQRRIREVHIDSDFYSIYTGFGNYLIVTRRDCLMNIEILESLKITDERFKKLNFRIDQKYFFLRNFIILNPLWHKSYQENRHVYKG